MGADLSVEDLTVRYGRAVAVSEVSISAPAGVVTAVVGPNGAGKSSLFTAIYGSVGSSGTVRVGGQDVSGQRATERARGGLSIVPQGRQLFAHLTVRENLQVMAEMLRLKRDAVDEAMDRFPILRDRSRGLAGVLSGGEQQMLVVSRALMVSPRVLLLDEVMTGLAPKIVQSLSDTFAGLAREGVTVLIAEPSIGAIRHIIERGYVLVRGQVVATDEEGGAALDRAYQEAIGIDVQRARADAAKTDVFD